MNENKFDGMGNIYAKFRPNYPQVFIDYLFANFGITSDSIFADIGAGTGILTKQLLEKKVKVYAVEPNDDMRKVAEANLSSFSNFILVNGTAENTTLVDNSIDIITVAQAFHWFDKQKFKAECQRILKPLGKVVLVWNSRDSASDLVMQNDLINRKYCPDFKGFSGNRRGKSSEEKCCNKISEGGECIHRKESFFESKPETQTDTEACSDGFTDHKQRESEILFLQ